MESNSSRSSSPESEGAYTPTSSQSTILMTPAPTPRPSLLEPYELILPPQGSQENVDTTSHRLASPEIRISDSTGPVSAETNNPDVFFTMHKSPGGYIFRLSSGQAIAAATHAVDTGRKDEEAEVIPDEDLMAMEVHGRCRFMWDTSSFQRNAPRERILNRCLHDQISGHVKNDGYFADAAYIGYSMYAEGPVFLKRRQIEFRRFDVINGVPQPLESGVLFRGNGFYLEPGYERAGVEVVPHYDAATTVNLAALHTWVSGSSAEAAFGEMMPVGYVVQQANKNAMDLADGRSPIPVTRICALDFQKLANGTVPEEQPMFPNEAEGFENPYLADIVCDATILARGCDTSPSGYSYWVPCTALLEYPDLLLKMLRDFAQKYTKDRLTEKSLLLAAHLWINTTKDPDLRLEEFAKQQKRDGMPYLPVPAISLAQCLIYYPHWLRWVSNMGLVEFIHPFRFIHKAVETDLANNPDAGMEVTADDISEGQIRGLMNQVRSMVPGISPEIRNPYFPFKLPGSTLPPLHKLDDEYYYTELTMALSGLENVRFLGLPTYARPRVPMGMQPDTTFVLVQPWWATTKVVCQNSVMPYLDYMEENPKYPGYNFVKEWTKPRWKDVPVKIRTGWQWW